MRILAAIFGILLIIVTLTDSFESIILLRRVARRFRLSRRSRSGHGLWLSRPDYWLCPHHLPGVLATRGQYFSPRCACRLARERDGDAAQALQNRAHRGIDPVPARMGEVVRRTAGESS